MEVKVADFGISKVINIIATCSLQTIAGTMWCDGWHLSCLNQSRISAQESTHSSQIYIAMPLHALKSVLQKLLSFRREKVKAGLRPTLPASLPNSLLSLINCCWDGDIHSRPSFSRLCTELRHLEGILMMSSKYSHEAMESPDTRFMGQQLGKG